jgi:hypothetical protein
MDHMMRLSLYQELRFQGGPPDCQRTWRPTIPSVCMTRYEAPSYVTHAPCRCYTSRTLGENGLQRWISGKPSSKTSSGREFPLKILQFVIDVLLCSFPDIGYFRDDDVQQELTNILSLYSVMHPDIEYRQGMHELLAPIYYAVGM